MKIFEAAFKRVFQQENTQNSFLPQTSTTDLLDDIHLDEIVW